MQFEEKTIERKEIYQGPIFQAVSYTHLRAHET